MSSAKRSRDRRPFPTVPKFPYPALDMRRFLPTMLLFAVLIFTPDFASATGPFDQGRMRVSIGGGTGGGSADFVVGLGFGYYVVDGLELGFDSDLWLGAEPNRLKLSPQMRYVFHMVPVVRPYIGTFYKHWFMGDGFDDIDTIGGRLGVFYVTGPRVFIGLGVVHEILLGCELEDSDECSETYPEFGISLTF